jgi:hypothetical protein
MLPRSMATPGLLKSLLIGKSFCNQDYGSGCANAYDNWKIDELARL